MQTPPSSSSASAAGDSPRPQRRAADQDTPRRLALPKMPNFLTLASPKRLQKDKEHHHESVSARDKNEPSRFLGDGVSFKAKLIGILEVGEARGDRMCQEALADLKMAIRAAGEHKQRITINIAIDGLRLRDEKTMDCLYHHPVHKISFIAQDMTDSRAFGYIFGSPDTGHRFFGIKTDKAAGQVVVAMRDLFQVVFELKKKEIELAKQHIEQQQMKFSVGKSLENLTYSKSLLDSGSRYSALKDDSKLENGCLGAASKSAQQTSEVIADLLDLEIELNSIQQGINQMEKITPSDPFGPDSNKDASFYDPFEDSFSPPPTAVILPPPPPSTRASSKRHLSLEPSSPPPANTSATTSPAPTPQTITTKAIAPLATTETWFDTTSDPLFGDNNTTSTTSGVGPTTKEQVEDAAAQGQFDVFTELDPLGTGRSKPYVDKKDFFQELKNPPKKVLKELVEPKDGEASSGTFAATFSHSVQPSDRRTPTQRKYSADVMALDPFADSDPFGEPDFVDEPFPASESVDPFDTCFADFTMFGSQKMDKSNNAADVFHGPLRVSLPPEKRSGGGGTSLLPPPPTGSKRASPTLKSSPKSPRSPLKQKPAVSDTPMVRIPSPKSGRRRTGAIRKSPLADEERISNSSAELADIAPEPPPRPASSKPPPLPPKKQQTSQQYKPPRPPPCEQYDYINNIEAPVSVSSPPLPMPVRRPRTSSGTEIPRPRQQQQQSQEMAQFSLPPPPAKEEKKPKVAANLTLRQLTNMNITELASSLNVSPGHLSKMTLQELAGFLASVSTEGSPSSNKDVSVEPQKAEESEPVERENYSALRESLDGEETFRADFDNNFADFSSTDFQNLKEDVFQEAPFDKYAVFRELEQEEKSTTDNVEDNTETAEFEDAVQDSIKEEAELPRSDSAMAEEGLRDEELEDYTEDGDKYAALREICTEDPGAQGEVDESDKDDSESVTKKVDEDLNLLSISRQPSDSPESVTMEPTNVRESIIESTILEEEVASDGGSQYEEPVEIPVEKQPLQQEEDEEVEVDVQSVKDDDSKEETLKLEEEPVQNIQSPVRAVSPPKELAIPVESNEEMSISPGGGWAKFEDEDKKLEDPEMSPWSVDGKEFGGKGFTPEKAYTPDSNSGSRRHRYRSRESPWQDDEDDDQEGDWEDRENGWRDEKYRRPRKRSPWGQRTAKKTSPWEDDDEESFDEVAYKPKRPGRPSSANRRPPSWDDEEPEYDEPRRRPPHRYEEKRDRSGSRGEYMRRREWEEQRSKYAAAYATWAERGQRKSGGSQERRSRESAAAARRKQFDSHYYNYRPPEYDEPYDPRYKSKKTVGSGPKRPASATDLRKGGGRRGRHSPDDDDDDEMDDEEPGFGGDGGRFRTPSADPARHWQDDFNSDHEAAPTREQHYEQRSYTMHSKRRQKQRRDDFYNKSPFEDDFSTRSFHATEFSSIESPTAETVRRQLDEDEQQQAAAVARISSTKASIGSSRRSPFEDDFTPPETRRGSARILSSISSDISRSPHDPAFCRADDVFLPEPEVDAPPHEHRRKQQQQQRWPDDRQVAGMKNRLSSSARMASQDSGNIKKSESVNIFSRESDPFADDDFFADTERPRKKNNGDAFKWSEPNFGSFDFKEEDEEEEE